MRLRSVWALATVLFVGALLSKPVMGQLIDRTLAPNAANQGIAKSFLAADRRRERQTSTRPNSSLFIINRDPARAIRRGRQIFQRKFTRDQGQGPLTGDGAGNPEIDKIIGAGLMDSCAGCHGRPRGTAGFGGDVVTRPDSRDAPHLFGLGLKEMLADEITADLREIRADAISDARRDRRSVTRTVARQRRHGHSTTARSPRSRTASVDTSRVEGVDPDLRVRPFFAHGETISIREFLVGAFNAEMGLERRTRTCVAARRGGRVVTPSGMVLDGRLDNIEAPPVSSTSEDFDRDGVSERDPHQHRGLHGVLPAPLLQGRHRTADLHDAARAAA